MRILLLLALLRVGSARNEEVDRRFAQAAVSNFQNSSTPITSSSSDSSSPSSSSTPSSSSSPLPPTDPGTSPTTSDSSLPPDTSTSSSSSLSSSINTDIIPSTSLATTSSSSIETSSVGAQSTSTNGSLSGPFLVSTQIGIVCNDGCTINAPSGALDWFWSTDYSFAPSTVSLVLTDPDPFQRPTELGYSIVYPTATLNITRVVERSSTGSTTTVTKTFTNYGSTTVTTIATTYYQQVPGPTAPSTSALPLVATIPLPPTSSFSSGETFRVGQYEFHPETAEVTYPGPDGSSYIQTYPTPFLRFSEYELVSRKPTRVNGAPACLVTTRTVKLSDENDVNIALSKSDYDGVTKVKGPLPAAFTSRLRPAQASCVLGAYQAIPTVYIIVDLIYAVEAALAISPTRTMTPPTSGGATQGPSSPGGTAPLPPPAPIQPPSATFNPGGGPNLLQPVPGQNVGPVTISYVCPGATCGVSVSAPHVENPGQGLVVPHTSFNIPAPTPEGQTPLRPGRPPNIGLEPQPVSVSAEAGARPAPPPVSTEVNDGSGAGVDTSGLLSQLGLPTAMPVPTGAKVMTIDGMVVTFNGENGYVFPDGRTLTPGGTLIENGHTIVLDSNGNIITVDGQVSTMDSGPLTTDMGGMIMSGLGDDGSSSTSKAAAPRVTGYAPSAGRTLLLGALLGFLGL